MDDESCSLEYSIKSEIMVRLLVSFGNILFCKNCNVKNRLRDILLS
jgi:hypothetical protein